MENIMAKRIAKNDPINVSIDPVAFENMKKEQDRLRKEFDQYMAPIDFSNGLDDKCFAEVVDAMSKLFK